MANIYLLFFQKIKSKQSLVTFLPYVKILGDCAHSKSLRVDFCEKYFPPIEEG